jgi:hypothetical protein
MGNWLQLGLCLSIRLKIQLEFFQRQTEFFSDGAPERSVNLSRIQLGIPSEFLQEARSFPTWTQQHGCILLSTTSWINQSNTRGTAHRGSRRSHTNYNI